MGPARYILFLGTGLEGSHLMAAGFARALADESVAIVSAAMMADTEHPVAEAVMAERGIDVSRISVKTPVDVEVFSFDMVVTLGDFDISCRPNLPGMPPHYHWDLPLKTAGLEEAEKLELYRRGADRLEQKVRLIFESEMLHGLSTARQNLELVLDNLAHAVMAHTINRRVFHFNQAAEELTGFDRSEVLGQDCHDVFKPRRFCGGDCLFCAHSPQAGRPDPLSRMRIKQSHVTFSRKDGAERVLDMTIKPLQDADGVDVGALVSFHDNTELYALKRRLQQHQTLRGLVGAEPNMLDLFRQIKEVAGVNVPVLVEGESGTGKELIANAIHSESARSKGPFVPINCGALPEGILESELFGHKRGAFTGAVSDKKGRFELADGGTLFLDEVAELSPRMQVKLLRVLQEQCFERVGGERRIHVNVRIVSATNQNLRALIEKKLFRRDLYYRLCVIPITPPPLRERPRDIPLLVEHFLALIEKDGGRAAVTVSTEAMSALQSYAWPGNVRELRNVIEYAHVKCQTGVIMVEHLPEELQPGSVAGAARRRGRRGPAPKLTRTDVSDAMDEAQGNKSRAARLLGVGRTTLYRYLAEMDQQ